MHVLLCHGMSSLATRFTAKSNGKKKENLLMHGTKWQRKIKVYQLVPDKVQEK